MSAELSVAEYSRTGIETSPKDRDSDAIERATMSFSWPAVSLSPDEKDEIVAHGR
jgi:hypothetical protein